jgi:hypothetical protein
MDRCVEPRLGVKVLSYDLLAGDEREEVDAHLRACAACRDLVDQTFGDEGALRELDWRVFQLRRRQDVPAHVWIGRRLMDLWVPFLLLVLAAAGVGLYLARRGPDPEQVHLLRLATLRTGVLDSLAAVPVPRLSGAPTSVVLQADRDAIAMVYEAVGGGMRRLIPGGDTAIPELAAAASHELALPEPETAGARLLLVLAPASAPRALADWDRAVLEYLGGEPEADGRRGWPQGTAPTLRWLR